MPSATSGNPNILLIQTDQHNPHIAGYEGNAVVHTQALDRLARQGTVFENAYCQSPLCVPSRTSMLAGKYAARCSAWNNGSVLFPEPQKERQKQWARSELLGEKQAQQFRMVRDKRWKLVDFPDAPWRLFDLANDPGELQDLADSPPPRCPLNELREKLMENGDWDSLALQRARDQERARNFKAKLHSQGTVQYRLVDGRIIEGDAQLYQPPLWK